MKRPRRRRPPASTLTFEPTSTREVPIGFQRLVHAWGEALKQGTDVKQLEPIEDGLHVTCADGSTFAVIAPPRMRK